MHRDAGLTARLTKCFFGYTSAEFLSHMVGEGMPRPQPDKVAKVIHAARPKTKKEVRSFMELVLIPSLAVIASPLTNLTRALKSARVEWGEPQENAFATLKKRLASAPILRLLELNKPFILHMGSG